MTGGSAGIGFEVAKQLATHGCRVLIASRDKAKVADAVARLKACRPLAAVDGYVVDLASFASIEALVKELKEKAKLKALHVLVDNAGVFLPPPAAAKTEAGLEASLAVNHVGTAYLTQLLLPLLKAGKPSRYAAGRQGAPPKGVEGGPFGVF